MKKMVFLCGLLFILAASYSSFASEPTSENWVLVSEDVSFSIYVDEQNIKRAPGAERLFIFRIVANYREDTLDFKSVSTLALINCNDQLLFFPEPTNAYSEHFGKGDFVSVVKEPDGREHDIEDDELYRYICNR